MKRKQLTMPIPEAAEILGVSRDAGYQAAKRGEIPVITIGRRKVVHIAEFYRRFNLIEEAAE